MKKFLEYLIVFLITYSVIELLTILVSSITYSQVSLTDFETIICSRLLVMELILSGVVSLVYNKVVRE